MEKYVFICNIYFLLQTETLNSIIQAAIIAGVQRVVVVGKEVGEGDKEEAEAEAEAEVVEEEEVEEVAGYKFIITYNKYQNKNMFYT